MIAFKHTEVKKKVVGVGFGIKSLFLPMDDVSQGKESLCVRKGNQPKIKDKDLAPEAFLVTTISCWGEGVRFKIENEELDVMAL